MKDIILPPNLVSDGCTFPGILKIFRGILGSDRYEEYCKEHDFLRRYGVVSPIKANWILTRRIASSHIAGILRSPFYFIFTTVSIPLYGRTEELPKGWEPYADLYR